MDFAPSFDERRGRGLRPRGGLWALRSQACGAFDLRLLVLLALWLLAVGYGLREPWPADEPRFALIGKQIVESGQWLVPARGPELYAEKPPVFLWLQAAAYALTGQTRLAFLLPSLLAGLCVLWLCHDLARRLWGRRQAWLSTLALLLTVQFTLQARSAQIDMVLTAFTTLGLYGLLRHLLLGPSWGWYALAGVATGLGVITKGTGFLPWLVLVPYAIARWRGMRGLASIENGGWRWAIGPLAMLAVIAAWAVPILWLAAQPGHADLAAYRDDLLLRQTVTRLTNPWHHLRPWWHYFVQVVPMLWLPLSLLGVWAARPWWRRLHRGNGRLALLLGWSLLVLLFFSASPGKREVYILPALPALALAFAPLLPGLLRQRRVHQALLGVTVLLAGLLTIGSAWALLGHPGYAERLAEQSGVRPWDWALAVGLLGLIWAFWQRRHGLRVWAGLMLLLWTGYGLIGYPSMDAARSGRALMEAAHAALPDGGELGLVAAPEQMALQAVGPIELFGFRQPLETQLLRARPWLAERPARRLLVHAGAMQACFDPKLSTDLGWSNRRHWYLLPAAALHASCAAPADNDGDDDS